MKESFSKRYLEHPHPLVVSVILVLSLLSFVVGKADYGASGVDNGVPPTYGARVEKIVSEHEADEQDLAFVTTSTIQELDVLVDIGLEERRVLVTNIFKPLKIGDRIFVRPASFDSDETLFEIMAIDRTRSLLVLTAFFALLVVLTSGIKGVKAFVGLVVSFAVIFNFIVPQILSGRDPVMVSMVGSIVILLATLYTSHGYNRKSVAALAGISFTLLFVGIFASFLIHAMNFTGNVGEDSAFLIMATQQKVNLVSLIIAGIIIAAIGVLDDIAVTQAAIVSELFETDKALRGRDAFAKAMRLGRDHISAVINTLVLAYTGASLPLVLLLIIGDTRLDALLSNEMIAEEIVRTLVATSGLVLAVPLTTAIAVLLIIRDPNTRLPIAHESSGHHH